MVKRTNTNVAREINKKRSASADLTSTHQRNHNRKHIDDDLIVLLGDSYENKRARQVGEWERAQLSNIHQAI